MLPTIYRTAHCTWNQSHTHDRTYLWYTAVYPCMGREFGCCINYCRIPGPDRLSLSGLPVGPVCDPEPSALSTDRCSCLTTQRHLIDHCNNYIEEPTDSDHLFIYLRIRFTFTHVQPASVPSYNTELGHPSIGLIMAGRIEHTSHDSWCRAIWEDLHIYMYFILLGPFVAIMWKQVYH